MLINPGQLGDILLSTTILPILQRQFPDTSIDMICREGAASILDGNPFIRKMYFLEHVMAWRRKDKKRSFLTFLKECSKVRALCKKEKYDACLLLRPYGGNLILLGRWLAPRVLIGYSTAGFGALLDISIAWKEGVHATEHLLELLKPLGIFEDRSHLTYLIYPSADDRHYVNKVLENYDLTKFVVVHPFAGDQNKTLPLSFWRQLFQQESRPILITGARQETFPVEQIESKPKQLMNLIGVFSIKQLSLLFQRAEKIYTLDSLAGHIAGWSQTPSDVFFKEGATFSPEWRPLGSHVTVIHVE